jgi:hypothetical protein
LRKNKLFFVALLGFCSTIQFVHAFSDDTTEDGSKTNSSTGVKGDLVSFDKKSQTADQVGKQKRLDHDELTQPDIAQAMPVYWLVPMDSKGPQLSDESSKELVEKGGVVEDSSPHKWETLKEIQPRIMKYWQQYYHREWELNYAMETPVNRKEFSFKNYSIYYAGGWKSTEVKVQSVLLKNNNEAEVTVLISLVHPGTGEMTRSVVRDRWIKFDDVWYHNFYDPLVNLRAIR